MIKKTLFKITSKLFTDLIDWNAVSAFEVLSEDFIREFQDKVNWFYISRHQTLSEDFIREFQDKIEWYYISIHQKLSEDFIREFQDKICWDYISIHQKLSEEFIIEFQDKVRWDYISSYQKLSEDFIREFRYKINWKYISGYQKLSEEFIEEFQDKVNWNYILLYQKLSEDFIKEFNIKKPKPENNWLYISEEDKLNYIRNYTNYKVVDNEYIIAYKSCRRNRYSKFNYQYRYEVGKTYESHCDCNIGEDSSFGLSAWTKGEALEYCKEKLFKVKINIEDIGVIVHNSKKIRCFRLTVLKEIKYLKY